MKKLFLTLPVIMIIAAGCSHATSTPTAQAPAPTSTDQSTNMPSDMPMTPAPAPSSSAPSGSGTVVKPVQTTVNIKNFAFAPQALTVKVGTTVIWVNGDNAAHTVTSTNGGPVSATIAAGTSFTYTFTKPGTYTYHCSIHTQMTGSVTVTN